jgi:TonB family protein
MRDATRPFVLAVILVLLGVLATGTLPAAGVSIKGYFTSAFSDVKYQQAMVQKVIGAWKNPATLPAVGKKAVVIVQVNREGKIAVQRLNMSSGAKAFDEAGQECIRSAAPYEPLPKAFRYPYMEVHFHFEVVK